jgi:hypothetical protein
MNDKPLFRLGDSVVLKSDLEQSVRMTVDAVESRDPLPFTDEYDKVWSIRCAYVLDGAIKIVTLSPAAIVICKNDG